jgi:hypothetical protein
MYGEAMRLLRTLHVVHGSSAPYVEGVYRCAWMSCEYTANNWRDADRHQAEHDAALSYVPMWNPNADIDASPFTVEAQEG